MLTLMHDFDLVSETTKCHIVEHHLEDIMNKTQRTLFMSDTSATEHAHSLMKLSDSVHGFRATNSTSTEWHRKSSLKSITAFNSRSLAARQYGEELNNLNEETQSLNGIDFESTITASICSNQDPNGINNVDDEIVQNDFESIHTATSNNIPDICSQTNENPLGGTWEDLENHISTQRLNLVKIRESVADGNCWYDSMSAVLQYHKIKNINHQDLRKLVVSNIRNTPNFQDWMSASFQNNEELLKRFQELHSRNGAYTDDHGIIVATTSHLIQRNIRIVGVVNAADQTRGHKSKPWTDVDEKLNKYPPLYIGHYGQHFVPLCKNEDLESNAQISFVQLDKLSEDMRRLYHSGTGDVEIIAKDGSIKCHSIIIQARCRLLNSICSGKVELCDFKKEDVSTVVEYLYSGVLTEKSKAIKLLLHTFGIKITGVTDKEEMCRLSHDEERNLSEAISASLIDSQKLSPTLKTPNEISSSFNHEIVTPNMCTPVRDDDDEWSLKYMEYEDPDEDDAHLNDENIISIQKFNFYHETLKGIAKRKNKKDEKLGIISVNDEEIEQINDGVLQKIKN